MSEVAVYRVSDGDLIVKPFETDAELLAYLNLPDDAAGRAILAGFNPEYRYQLARLRAIAACLADGFVPRVALQRRAS